ncbi:MAG TPA: aquaporin [Chloroflexota bacterium]|nr:aquaporin [Chloroflexota bacterium]
MEERNLLKAAVAEGVGTFALIFIGVLAIAAVTVVRVPAGLTNLTSIALAHGLTIMVMVAALGAVSGGHFNPAITFGFVVTRRMSILAGVVYWLAQLIGATLAAFLLLPIIGMGGVGTGTPALTAGVSFWSGVILEGVGTFFLVLAVFGTAVDQRAPPSIYPIAIGLTIAFDIMAFGPLTGGAVNPARAFGPALVSGHWADQLVYWIGGLVGGAAAALLDNYFFMERHAGPPVPREIPTEEGHPAA